MSAEYARLQEAIAITASTTQDRRDALDAGSKHEVAVQVMVLTTGVGTVKLQHAPILEDSAFEDVSGSVDLATAGPKTILVTGHTRFLRWKATITSGTPQFRIDTIGRE
jgi:hypothetical protein